MEKHLQVIRNITFFSLLKDEDIATISRIAYVKEFKKGHLIFQEGEKRDTLYIILEGRVKISLYDEDGREYVVDTIGQDGFFGEYSLFDEFTGFANIVTTEPGKFLVIRRNDFMRLLLENPTFTVGILKTMTKRLRDAYEKLQDFAFLNVEERIYKYLRDYAEQSGLRVKDRLIIDKGPTQVEIANLCGCSRETASRMIKSLVQKGKVSVMKRRYTIRPVYPP